MLPRLRRPSYPRKRSGVRESGLDVGAKCAGKTSNCDPTDVPVLPVEGFPCLPIRGQVWD